GRGNMGQWNKVQNVSLVRGPLAVETVVPRAHLCLPRREPRDGVTAGWVLGICVGSRIRMQWGVRGASVTRMQKWCAWSQCDSYPRRVRVESLGSVYEWEGRGRSTRQTESSGVGEGSTDEWRARPALWARRARMSAWVSRRDCRSGSGVAY